MSFIDQILGRRAVPTQHQLPSRSRSVVSPQRKRNFEPNAISARISDCVSTSSNKVDELKLAQFAKANNVWRDRYADLNIGMRRMVIGVRIAAKFRKGKDIAWLD